LGEILLRYKREVTPLKKSAANESIRIDRLVRDEAICQYKATALTGKLFAEWRDQRSQQVTGSTVNREIDILSHAINTARKEWGIHISNPIETIRRPKHNRSRERRLSVDEESKLLAELQIKTRNPWIKAVVVFAIETGMRRGEILSLTWSNVDLQKRVARLIDTKNGEGRSVPLTLKATALLEGLPRSIDGRVFATTAEAVKLSFARAVERAGIDDLHFHDLRHEGVSRLFEKGLNVMEVASISGHKTLQMLKRYTHLSSDQLLAKIG
jgi:integrase